MLPKWPNDASSHRCEGGTGTAEAAKLQDAGISLKQCQKNQRQKKAGLLNWEGIGAVSAELCEQLKRNTKRSAVVHHRSGFDDGARFECSDGERRMAVANALGRRGSKCVTAAPWKSPMMAWSTVCDDCFRVANRDLGVLNSVSTAASACQQHASNLLLSMHSVIEKLSGAS